MISVVIPSKDRRVYLEKTLPSFLNQPEVSEVIVVIDGSTDGTLEFLKEYNVSNEKLRYIDNGTNKGIPYSKNAGVTSATSEYIFIGEDDVELTSGFFATLLKHMKTVGADVICGRNIFRYDHETAETAIRRTDSLTGAYINKHTIEIDSSINIGTDQLTTMSASPVLGKAKIFKSIPFDERYKVNFWREETDFQLSIQEAGYKLGSCPHAICFNYVIANDKGGVHGAGNLKRVRWMVINNWMFVKKHEPFIQKNFLVSSKYMYISAFTARMGYSFVKRIVLRGKRST